MGLHAWGYIFMIGVMIPFIGMFMFPAALYAAIALAGFKGPLQLAGDQLVWPLLAAAGVATITLAPRPHCSCRASYSRPGGRIAACSR